MVIQVTDEIRSAYALAWFRRIGFDDEDAAQLAAAEVADPMPWRDAALSAVLALVERDRRAECGAAGPDGKWCERRPHDPTEYHGWIGDGELVRW